MMDKITPVLHRPAPVYVVTRSIRIEEAIALMIYQVICIYVSMLLLGAVHEFVYVGGVPVIPALGFVETTLLYLLISFLFHRPDASDFRTQ